VFHTVGSQSGYYAGPQCNGVLFTAWWKSPEEKTEILMPAESQFVSVGDHERFENSTHNCHQCLDCAEGYHASCFLKTPPEVGVVYRQTVTKKFNSWDPESDMTSYVDVGDCGPRGDDASADLSSCDAEVLQSVKGVDGSIVSTIGGCDYLSYTVYSCSNGFDPTSTLTSYSDMGSCGPRGDDAEADLKQCPDGHTIVDRKANVEFKVVAKIGGCSYFAYTIYTCTENKYHQNTDIAVYFETAPSSISASGEGAVPKFLIGEMRYLEDIRGHIAGGVLESPSGVQYSCLDTSLAEIVHAKGQWRGVNGTWRDRDPSMFKFLGSRSGGMVGPTDRLLSNSCANGIKDGDEYNIDCGGGCMPCNFEMISCDDGIMNGNEEYIDCGGSCSESCSEKGNAESYFKVTSRKDNGGESFTWDEAAKLCIAKNSALAIVSSTEQNIAVTTLCGNDKKCWIGLHRKDSCKGPSCLKWTPREDGSVFYLDQTIFNHWGCHGGGGGTGCYFQYKDEYTKYYMYTENHGIMPTNAWFASKDSKKANVAICGTPPLSLSSPSPRIFWRVRSDEPWLLDLHFVPFFEYDCQTPVLIGDPISISASSITSAVSGSSGYIMIHFSDPTPIGCFRLDSAGSYSKDGGVPIMTSVSNGKVFLEYSDDEVTWVKATAPMDNLLSESDARSVKNPFDPSSTLTSYADRYTCGPRGDDAKANLTQCSNGYTIVKDVPNVGYKVVAELDGCEYFSYTIYQCKPLSPFNPSSTLTSYTDRDTCGPRGDDAKANLTQCSNGYTIVKDEPNVGYKVVAEINGCEYFSYAIYQCKIACTESDNDAFLFKYNKKKNKPVEKSCGWLSGNEKRKKYCDSKVDYHSSNNVALSPPQDVCQNTCESCDPCYENSKSKFLLTLPVLCEDVKSTFAIGTRGKLKSCKQWKKKKRCSNNTVAGNCPLTCSTTCKVEPPVLQTCKWLKTRSDIKDICERNNSYGGYGPPKLHCSKTCMQESCLT